MKPFLVGFSIVVGVAIRGTNPVDSVRDGGDVPPIVKGRFDLGMIKFPCGCVATVSNANVFDRLFGCVSDWCVHL